MFFTGRQWVYAQANWVGVTYQLPLTMSSVFSLQATHDGDTPGPIGIQGNQIYDFWDTNNTKLAPVWVLAIGKR